MTNINQNKMYNSINASSLRILAFAILSIFIMLPATSFGQCTPTITPSGPIDLCTGGSVTLTSSLGSSYLWNTGATTSAIIVGSKGDYWVTVDDGQGCVETSDTITVTLYFAAPGKINKIIGAPRACPGDSEVYVVKSKPRTAAYVWTVSGGLTINGGTTWSSPDTAVTVDYGPGFVGSGVIQVYASNGCGNGTTKLLNVSIGKPNPTSAISGPISGLCGTTQTYSVDPIAGATFNWTAPTGSNVITGQGTNIVQIAFAGSLNNGFVKVDYSNVCGTSKEEKLAIDGEVIITGQPVDLNACDSTQASFTVVADGSPASYQWRKNGVNIVNGGAISGATTATLIIDPVLPGDAGSYDCVIGSNCSGNTISDAATLVVSPAPVTPGAITGTANACPGTTGEVFTINSVGADSYQWVAYHGATIVSGQGDTSITVDFGPTTFSGYYIVVKSQTSCGVSDSVKKWVRYSLSVPTYDQAPTTSCAGQTGVTYSVLPVAGAGSYNWTMPANATLVSGAGTETITVDFGGAFTGGDICVSATNSCVTTADRCLAVRTIPNDAGNIAGVFSGVCSTTEVYTINSVGGATGYNWTVPTGATIMSGQGTTSITVDFSGSFASGDVCIEASNTCGASVPKCKPATGFPGKSSGIVGNAAPCASSSGEVYSTPAIAGASSYQWTVPAGATITSGQGTASITVDFGPTDGIIKVAGVNACGTGYTKNLRIIFGCRLAQSGSISSENSLVAYPNPFSNDLKLMLTSSSEELVIIQLFDQYGKLVINEKVSVSNESSTHVFDTANLAPGMYFIQVSDGDSVQKLKVVKQ